MRIGVLVSTAGSAFIASWKILKSVYGTENQFFILVDRDCGIEEFCAQEKISCHKIKKLNNEQFSSEASQYYKSIGGIDVILLFTVRIITPTLFNSYPCLNIHPSLLPAFKGLDGVKLFLASSSKFLGASIHLVDKGIDTGLIIAQVSTPVGNTMDEKLAYKISYLQKVYLTLMIYCILKERSIEFNADFSNFVWRKQLSFSHAANPTLTDVRIIERFNDLQKQEKTFIN
jgi:phosphoribosylglycinamide formyltransferase-1